jgi:N-acetylmuramoyl-L-alanine amidase
MSKLLLILGAGHGEQTPGKRTFDGITREWTFNDAVVDQLQVIFNQYEDVKVVRMDDPTGKRDVPLKERTDKANALYRQYKALGYRVIYVSIHANAYGSTWNSAQGTETFVYKKTLTEAYKLATAVQNNLVSIIKRPNRGVKEGDLHIVRETMMTAILVECAFMSNKEEAALLASDKFRKDCALGIARGILTYHPLKLKNKPAAKPVATSPTLYHVQLGPYSSARADQVIQKLRKDGYGRATKQKK